MIFYKYDQVGRNDSKVYDKKEKKDKLSDTDEDDEEDKTLIRGKYRSLNEVPREVSSHFIIYFEKD